MAKSYYEILEVDSKANESEIRKAYRLKMREVHPDLNPDKARAQRRTRELNIALEVLTNPAKRKRYDEQLLRMGKAKANAEFESAESENKEEGSEGADFDFTPNEPNKTQAKPRPSKRKNLNPIWMVLSLVLAALSAACVGLLAMWVFLRADPTGLMANGTQQVEQHTLAEIEQLKGKIKELELSAKKTALVDLPPSDENQASAEVKLLKDRIEELESNAERAAVTDLTPVSELKQPASVMPTNQQNTISLGTWKGNLANRSSFDYSLVIEGKQETMATWNGKDVGQVERIGGRNWVRKLELGYAEFVQHEDMMFVIMWNGELGEKLPTSSPKRLGVLYRNPSEELPSDEVKDPSVFAQSPNADSDSTTAEFVADTPRTVFKTDSSKYTFKSAGNGEWILNDSQTFKEEWKTPYTISLVASNKTRFRLHEDMLYGRKTASKWYEHGRGKWDNQKSKENTKESNQHFQIPNLDDPELVTLLQGWLVEYRSTQQLIKANRWKHHWWHPSATEANWSGNNENGAVQVRMQPVVWLRADQFYVSDSKSKGKRWNGLFIPQMRPLALLPPDEFEEPDRNEIEAEVRKLFDKETAESTQAAAVKGDEVKVVDVPNNTWSKKIKIEGRIVIIPDPSSRWNSSPDRWKDCDFRGHADTEERATNGMKHMALCYRINGGEVRPILGGQIISGEGVIEFGSSGLSGNDNPDNNRGSIAVSVLPLVPSSTEAANRSEKDSHGRYGCADHIASGKAYIVEFPEKKHEIKFNPNGTVRILVDGKVSPGETVWRPITNSKIIQYSKKHGYTDLIEFSNSGKQVVLKVLTRIGDKGVVVPTIPPLSGSIKE